MEKKQESFTKNKELKAEEQNQKNVEKEDLSSEDKQQKIEEQNQESGFLKGEEKVDLSLEDKQQKIEEQNQESGLVPDLTNKLTHDALLKLFYWLSVDDLVSVQRVCHSWRVSAHDPSLWNDYTLRLGFPNEENKRKVIIMKGVRKISGIAYNDVFDLILENILHLKHMNCSFRPPMTSSQVGSLIEIFPQLESITIDLCAKDSLQSIEMLKSSQYLKEICLTLCTQTSSGSGMTLKQFGNSHQKTNQVEYCSNMLNAFEILTDITNFSALTNLDMLNCVSRDALENYICSCVLVDVIARRSHQLLSLYVNIAEMTTDVILSVNMCSKLKNLYVILNEECSAGLNIDNMPQLQSLHVSVQHKDNAFLLGKLRDSFIRGTLLHLVELSLGFFPQDVDVLTAVVQNAKQLKKLCCHDCEIDETQLKDISSLQKLEYLSLGYLLSISPKIINYISSVCNLQYLYLYGILVEGENLCYCIDCMMHSLKRLTYLSIDFERLRFSFKNRDSINKYLEDKSITWLN